jgi:hypothetical protein
MPARRKGPVDRLIWGVPEGRFVFVWRWITLVNAGISVDIWSTTQGWKLTVPHKLLWGDIGSHSLAVYGIIICAPLLGAASLLLWAYAHADRSRAWSWTARVPDLWKLGAQPGSIGAKLDKGVALLVAIGVPSGALAHFVDKTFGGTVYVDRLPFAAGAIEHLTRYMPLGEAFRLGSDHTAQFETPSTGITYYPFWESWTLLLVVVFTVAFAAVCVSAAIRQQRPDARPR